MFRHWLTATLLLALVAVGILLLDSPRVLQQDGEPTSEESVQLTGYLTGVRTTRYNAVGEVEYNFTAQRMSYFQPDPDLVSSLDYTTIEQPAFTFFQRGDQPWHVQARQGRSTGDGELLILREDVRVWQPNPGNEPTVMTTSRLEVRPDEQVAETDQFVMITRPRMVTKGVGLRADLKQETFTIRSQGRTVYEPNP